MQGPQYEDDDERHTTDCHEEDQALIPLGHIADEKAGSSNRRAPWWNGGSDEMGGAMPCGAGIIGRWLVTKTLRDVKCSVS